MAAPNIRQDFNGQPRLAGRPAAIAASLILRTFTVAIKNYQEVL
jgi:hypothetical protein